MRTGQIEKNKEKTRRKGADKGNARKTRRKER